MKFIISSLVPLTKLSPLLCEQVCKLSLKLKLLKLKLLYMVVHVYQKVCVLDCVILVLHVCLLNFYTHKVKNLLRMLIIDNKRGLKSAIALLDPFPDREEFQEFTAMYQDVRLADGPTTLCQVLQT